MPYEGAVQAAVADPNDPNITWIATVNGGIWRTNDALSTVPTWVPQTNHGATPSMSTMVLDPTDPTNQTLVAGTGLVSSFFTAGALTGLLRTTDGGTTWVPLGQSELGGRTVTGAAARGNIILAGTANTTTMTYGQVPGGLFRSGDAGASFQPVAAVPGQVFDVSGVPGARSATDPNLNLIFVATSQGIFASPDAGSTWTNITGNLGGPIGGASRIRLAVSTPGSVGAMPIVYAGVVQGDAIAGLYRSSGLSGSWTKLDLPGFDKNDQAKIHFSLAVSPGDPNVIFLGKSEVAIYRGIVTATPGAGQGSVSWNLIGSDGTTGSGPNSDSRNITFDANGDLIETDDGGIYRLSNPGGGGVWTSMLGSLQDTELHSIAFDPRHRTIVGGAQDNGDPGSSNASNSQWADQAMSGADGGAVQVSPTGIRYVSAQHLEDFIRRLPNGRAVPIPLRVAGTRVDLTTYAEKHDDELPFVTPFRLDAVAPHRLVIGSNYLYESGNLGQTVRRLNRRSFGLTTALAYGGMSPKAGRPGMFRRNPGVLYVGTDKKGSFLVLRPNAGARLRVLATYPGGSPRQIVLNPSNWRQAFIVDNNNRVWETSDGGATAAGWTDLTGNLSDPQLRTLAFIPDPNSPGQYALLAGGQGGVYRMLGSAPGVWGLLGNGLPSALVYQMDYNTRRNNDTLVVGTLGRGAWTLSPVAGNPELFAAPPTITPLAYQAIPADTTSAPIAFTVGSASPSAANLVVTATSSNPGLIPNDNLILAGTGANRSLSITPAPGATGTSTITVTVSDGTSSSFQTFPVVVAEVGTGLALYPISGFSVPTGSAKVVPFAVANAQNPQGLTYSVSSTNPGLIPDANVAVNGTAGTLTVTPVDGMSGNSTITLTVDDNGTTASTTFTVVVSNTPEMPAVDPIKDQSAPAGRGAVAIPFHVNVPAPDLETAGYISDGPDGSAAFGFSDVTLYVQSSKPRVVPTASLNIVGGQGDDFTLEVNPASSRPGSSMITISADNGDFQVDRSFRIRFTRPGGGRLG